MITSGFSAFLIGLAVLVIGGIVAILLTASRVIVAISGFIWKHIGFIEIVAIVVCCLSIGLAIYRSIGNEIKKNTRILKKIRNVLLDTVAVALCNGINALLVIFLFFQCGKYTYSDWELVQFLQVVFYAVIWIFEFLVTIGIIAMYFGMQMFFLTNKESAFLGPTLAIIYFIVLHYIIYFLYFLCTDTVVDVLSGLPWLQNLFSAPLHRLISSFFTSIF